jgi:zinc/manganese transport system permease protein
LTGGYVVGILGYSGGLALSAVFDLPAGAMIVWTLLAAAALISFLSRPLYETPENH